jgi:hypothetical protein
MLSQAFCAWGDYTDGALLQQGAISLCRSVGGAGYITFALLVPFVDASLPWGTEKTQACVILFPYFCPSSLLPRSALAPRLSSPMSKVDEPTGTAKSTLQARGIKITMCNCKMTMCYCQSPKRGGLRDTTSALFAGSSATLMCHETPKSASDPNGSKSTDAGMRLGDDSIISSTFHAGMWGEA